MVCSSDLSVSKPQKQDRDGKHRIEILKIPLRPLEIDH